MMESRPAGDESSSILFFLGLFSRMIYFLGEILMGLSIFLGAWGVVGCMSNYLTYDPVIVVI